MNTLREVSRLDADVLYFGGDLAEPDHDTPQRGWDRFERGLEMLAASPAPVKLFTLGNNDLEQIRNSFVSEHYDEMASRVGAYGFSLLDAVPKVVGDVAFVGNVGWYDGTLWTKHCMDDVFGYPNDPAAIRARATAYFCGQEFKGRLLKNYSPDDLFAHCTERLSNHLDAVHADTAVSAVVLGVHFVPSTQFVMGDTPKFAYLNWYMGSQAHAEHYLREKVVLGFTGHTHRSDAWSVGLLKVHNVSGPKQPRLFELEKSSDGLYVAKTVL